MKIKFKKIAKRTGVFIGVLILLLALTPYLFKDKIQSMIKTTLNENMEATVSFKNVGLSFFKHFPKASIQVDDLSIINKAPFEGDTLFIAEKITLTTGLAALFNDGTEPIDIQEISAKNGQLNIRLNKLGIGNFDIAKKTPSAPPANRANPKPYTLNIQAYALENVHFSFIDELSNTKVHLQNIQHTGSGDFSTSELDLQTKTTTLVSFTYGNTQYLKDIKLRLDAIIGVDFKENKYIVKDNKALINQLPLEFDGFIQLLGNGQLLDLKFKTPTSSFKNLLALIPATYAADLKKIQTKGDFNVFGAIEGTLSKTSIPKLDINIQSTDAMFKFDALPKAVQNIHINTNIINTTGAINDTKIALNKLSFSIDKDVFNAKGTITNLSKNPTVQAVANGQINLSNISQVYPNMLADKISGSITTNIATTFDMHAVENGNYQHIKNRGSITLNGFTYIDKEFANPIIINKASVQFNPSNIKLSELDAQSGKSDVHLTGSLDNFYGFLFKNQELKGAFALTSNHLNISDFMSSTDKHEVKNDSAETVPIKIPAFLNGSFTGTAKEVIYDNLSLKNVTGQLSLKNETATLKNVKMDLFGGQLGVNGAVSTLNKKPGFTMNLDMETMNISNSFSQIGMLSKIAPIAKTIKGTINSTIQLTGDLTPTLTPDLNTISGNLMGQLINPTVHTKNSKLLSSLQTELTFLDTSKLNLSSIKAQFSFKNGKVKIKPFKLAYQDMQIEVQGSHSFTQELDYNLTFHVPTKHLGTTVATYLTKLPTSSAQQLKTIPVSATVSGAFTNPLITTNLQQATSNLITKLIAEQKKKVVNKGKSSLLNLLNANKKPKDSTKGKVTNILKGLLGNKKKKKN